jgi:hypothetical protein
VFTAREITRFTGVALLTGGAPAGEYAVPLRQWFVWIVLVDSQQAPFTAAPDKYHRAARAFALPAVALERCQAIGKGLAKIAARR